MSTTISVPLTTHLLSLSPSSFHLATHVPFLSLAGTGTLPRPTLQQWLSQDRLYAQHYMHFASHILSHISLPVKVEPEDINEGLADLLVEALVGIRRELRLFGDVAGGYGLVLDGGEEGEEVRGYRELFQEVGKGKGTGVLEGMVLLWGTEKCYLEAWRYAKSFLKEGREEDADGGALRKEFIPNWTSGEFVSFVERLGEAVDLLWEKEGDEEGKERSEEIWRRVLEVEREFWPVV